MALDDIHPTCYGLEPVTRPPPAHPPAPPPAPQGMITEFENAVLLIEEVMEPKTWIRRAAFGLARLIRKKLR